MSTLIFFNICKIYVDGSTMCTRADQKSMRFMVLFESKHQYFSLSKRYLNLVGKVREQAIFRKGSEIAS